MDRKGHIMRMSEQERNHGIIRTLKQKSNKHGSEQKSSPSNDIPTSSETPVVKHVVNCSSLSLPSMVPGCPTGYELEESREVTRTEKENDVRKTVQEGEMELTVTLHHTLHGSRSSSAIPSRLATPRIQMYVIPHRRRGTWGMRKSWKCTFTDESPHYGGAIWTRDISRKVGKIVWFNQNGKRSDRTDTRSGG